MDSPQNVISHSINHEIGHMVFNKSKLENKEELLREVWKKTDVHLISQRANSNEREFFAETFAIYEKGGILNAEVMNFIEEVLK